MPAGIRFSLYSVQLCPMHCIHPSIPSPDRRSLFAGWPFVVSETSSSSASAVIVTIARTTFPCQHWCRWLDVESRCVVPATAFSEYGSVRDVSTGKLPLYWFALSSENPLFFFAGIWGTWKGVRKVKEGELDHELFGFLTCEPNGVVAPIHQKAMPVILRNAAEVEQWLTAPAAEALNFKGPCPMTS